MPRQAASRRVANLHARPGVGGRKVLALLRRPTGFGKREDRTCDRCRAYAPSGTAFWPFLIRPRGDIALGVGMCNTCARREGIA
ncbi:hypothetical protein GCM10011509_10590 [Ornithinimicrobium pekingense]|uniref:HNH endonuclease n=1 Tax=Ornithinimicrobium pekingense TaxID=384677 RepID=A0ABQ2F5I1_9MICO|nr:hypothetical protein GCM10011509_10590 [Ornithinimicrobium pekingense]